MSDLTTPYLSVLLVTTYTGDICSHVGVNFDTIYIWLINYAYKAYTKL